MSGGSGLDHAPTEALRAEIERRECATEGHPPDLLMVNMSGDPMTAQCRCGQAQYRIERIS